MSELRNRQTRVKSWIRVARYLWAISVCFFAVSVADAQQVISTAVSSGPNVIAMTTYQGNVYYATATPGAIYKLAPGGTPTLIAGTPNGGPTNGPTATQTSIAPGMNGLAFDAAGNLYFSEPTNHQIRIVSAPVDAPTATINTFQTAAAAFPYPGAIAIHNGTLYWADEATQIVSFIDQNGFQQSFAGPRAYNAAIFSAGGYAGDDGPATGATLNHPRGIAFDAAGNMYIADTGNHAIRRVDTHGVITTIAGTGTAGFSGDGASATAAQLFLPEGLACDSSGNIFVGDTSNNRVREINVTTGTITTVAGDGNPRLAGDGSLASSASLAFPAALAFDPSENLLVADSQNNRIRSINGGIISTIEGNTQPAYTGDGAAHGNFLNQPEYITFDSAGNMFFSDSENSRIRRVDAGSQAITTVAGNGTAGNNGMGGAATKAEIGCPAGLAFAKNGSLLIADPCAQQVFSVAASSDGLVKGRADESISVFVSGLPQGLPIALSVESTGTVIIGTLPINGSSSGVLAVDPSTGSFVERLGTSADSLATGPGDLTLVGSDTADSAPVEYASGALAGRTFASFRDFGLTSSDSEFVGGLAFDQFGNVYASGSETTHTVFEFTTTQALVLAGSRSQGYGGDGGSPLSAQLNQPLGIALDPSGNVFIADTGNNVIRRVGAATLVPPPGVPSLDSVPAKLTKENSALFAFSDIDPTVTSFACTLDGITSACSGSASYSNLADGPHTFSVIGQRTNGVTSAPASYSWVVDTTPPPVPSIDSHPANPSASANSTFAFSDSEAGVSFTCSFDGVSGPCTTPAVHLGSPDGPHTFSVIATDAVGNQSVANNFAWTISTTPPPPPHIDSAPAALSNVASPTFSFSDSQAGVVFLCQVNGGAEVPCSSPLILSATQLTQGANTFSVLASDPVSGRSSAATSFSWTVDTVGPLVQITDGPGSIVFPRPSNFNFQAMTPDLKSPATDLAGYLCSLDGETFSPCTPPVSLQVNDPGVHTFGVEATDVLGNIGEITSYGWSVTTCTCSIAGAYSNPGFSMAPAGRATSPDKQFAVSTQVNAGANEISLALTRASDGSIAYATTLGLNDGSNWQFSPDSKRFMIVSQPTGMTHLNVTMIDLSGPSSKIILNTMPPTSTEVGLQFSPSGAYFIVSYLLSQTQFGVDIYRVTNVASAARVYHDEFTFLQGTITGSPDDPFGSAIWGFNTSVATAAPEVSFVYAYVTGVNTVQLVGVDLTAGKRTVNTQISAISAYWQFNPCGSILAVVSQPLANQLNVQLFNMTDGSTLGGNSFPVENIILTTDTKREIANIGTQPPIVLAMDPDCSPNTPTGPNVSVALRDAATSQDPATVTFSDVTQSGQTGVTSGSSGAAAPATFSLGTPPSFYDIVTTASYSGDITVCLTYAGVAFTGQPQLFHFVNGAWVNVTTSVDTATQTICGTVSSLSPFAIFAGPGGDQPPTAQAGPPQIVEATSSAGAAVLLSGSASDPDNDPLTLTWSESGATLGSGAQITLTLLVGVHTITLTADDGRGGTGTSTVLITVQDTTPPILTLPLAHTLEAIGPIGAVATFSVSAIDLVDGTRPVFCSPASGSTFPLGVTTVTCSASDLHGNSAPGTFTITVRDTTPPVVTPPMSIIIPATEAGGARGSSWPALAAFLAGAIGRDLVDFAPLQLPPQAGTTAVDNNTLFPYGTTTVTFSFRDASNNMGSASASVTVILGSIQISAQVAAQGKNSDGTYFVDVRFTNSGTGNARKLRIDLITALLTKGTGKLALVLPVCPAFVGVGNLDAGASDTVHMVLKLPATIRQFVLGEVGNFDNVKGVPRLFAEAQTVNP